MPAAAFRTSATPRCLPARCVHARVARPSRAAQHKTAEQLPAVDPVWWLSTVIASPLIFSGAAQATEGKLGILEGRSVALIHPIIMATLFLTTAYTGWLGWQVHGQEPRKSNDDAVYAVLACCLHDSLCPSH